MQHHPPSLLWLIIAIALIAILLLGAWGILH
jgi:hypothetical protein